MFVQTSWHSNAIFIKIKFNGVEFNEEYNCLVHGFVIGQVLISAVFSFIYALLSVLSYFSKHTWGIPNLTSSESGSGSGHTIVVYIDESIASEKWTSLSPLSTPTNTCNDVIFHVLVRDDHDEIMNALNIMSWSNLNNHFVFDKLEYGIVLFFDMPINLLLFWTKK